MKKSCKYQVLVQTKKRAAKGKPPALMNVCKTEKDAKRWARAYRSLPFPGDVVSIQQVN